VLNAPVYHAWYNCILDLAILYLSFKEIQKAVEVLSDTLVILCSL